MQFYKAPVEDIKFLLRDFLELSNKKSFLNKLDLEIDDLEAILNEAAKLCEETLLPLNQSGDQEGCKYEKGQVFAPKGFKSFAKAMPIWLKEKLFQKKLLFNKFKDQDQEFLDEKRIFFSEHHLSHAASAFFPSPFEEAIVLTADGVGEWATTTVAIGKRNKLEIKKEIHFPHSLGLLYSAFTYYTGFKVNSGEYKLMGLAPYGKPIYEDKIRKLVDIKEDGTFRL